MSFEEHENIVEQTISKLINEGWICEKSYTFNNFRYDILAFNPKTKESKAFEIQMNGEPKKKYIDSPFPIEYIYPEKQKPKKEINHLSIKYLSTFSSPITLNIILGIEEQPRYYSEIIMFIPGNKLATGKTAYHIRKLVKLGLIRRKKGKYIITDLSSKTLTFIREIKNDKDLFKPIKWEHNKNKHNHKPIIHITDPNSLINRLKKILLDNPPETFTYKELVKILDASTYGSVAVSAKNLDLNYRVKLENGKKRSE